MVYLCFIFSTACLLELRKDESGSVLPVSQMLDNAALQKKVLDEGMKRVIFGMAVALAAKE